MKTEFWISLSLTIFLAILTQIWPKMLLLIIVLENVHAIRSAGSLLRIVQSGLCGLWDLDRSSPLMFLTLDKWAEEVYTAE